MVSKGVIIVATGLIGGIILYGIMVSGNIFFNCLLFVSIPIVSLIIGIISVFLSKASLKSIKDALIVSFLIGMIASVVIFVLSWLTWGSTWRSVWNYVFGVLLVLIVVILPMLIGGSIYAFISLKKKQSTLQVIPTGQDLPGDGKSPMPIKVQFVDGQGKPVKQASDTIVKLSATSGTIKDVVVKAGFESAEAVLVSGIMPGPVTIMAESQGSKASAVVNFSPIQQRFCMHCRASMAVDASKCPACGLEPPSGTDTKTCVNCNNVLPETAKFCDQCGAKQPVQ